MLTDVSDGKWIFKHILIECTIIRRKNEIKLSFPKTAFSLTDIIFALRCGPLTSAAAG